MFTGSMMKLKSILYGTLPFYYTKVFEPSSPKLAYYDYFRKRGYTRYPYDFAAEYLEMSIAVLQNIWRCRLPFCGIRRKNCLM